MHLSKNLIYDNILNFVIKYFFVIGGIILYSSDQIKKTYSAQCSKQRISNLIKLRKEIAHKTQAEFIKETGFTKNDISTLESGDKNLSLYHIHAYKTYFIENFNLDVSVDFLMGYTDVMENQTMNIANDLGLSADTITVLKNLSEIKRDVLHRLCAENNLLELLLGELWLYANTSTFADIQINEHITGTKKHITDKREVDAILRFKAVDSFDMILRFIKESFSASVSQAAQNTIDLLEERIRIQSLEEQLNQIKKS